MMLSSSKAWRAAVTGLSRLASVMPHDSLAPCQHLVTASRGVLASQGAEQTNNTHNYQPLFALICLTAGTALLSKKNKANCCGITGVVSTNSQDARYSTVFLVSLQYFKYILTRDLREYLLESLAVLKNRGYDSAGLATMPRTGGPMVRMKTRLLVTLRLFISHNLIHIHSHRF